MLNNYRLKFPPEQEHDLGQDEAYFYLTEGENTEKMLFHDYDQIFSKPGLYEQLFYSRLKCTSPSKVAQLLQDSLDSDQKTCSELRVLDLGAGNGMMAERLRALGVARIVGADIIPEARDAAYRDRPDVYDDYVVADFTSLSETKWDELNEWEFDCLTSVAALGFGDIPPEAFFSALQFIREDGWVAFNIKETFLDNSDQSGFSRVVRELIFSKYLDVYQLERYTHRLSMEGKPLKYFALVGRLTAAVPKDFLSSLGIA